MHNLWQRERQGMGYEEKHITYDWLYCSYGFDGSISGIWQGCLPVNYGRYAY